MFLLDGEKFNPQAGFEKDGIQYTVNWFSCASAAEKAALNITEIPDPVRPDERFFYVQENADGSFLTVMKDLEPIKQNHKTDIDVTCGNIRESVVSKGLFIAEEYRVAYDEALAFRSTGYAGEVPFSVKSWAEVSLKTAQWAADDIITTRNGYVHLLNSVRDFRLKSKAAVDACSTPEALLAAVEAFNTQVQAMGV